MKQRLTAKQIALRALENVEVFGDEAQKSEARFLAGVIEDAAPERRAVNFARRRKAEAKEGDK